VIVTVVGNVGLETGVATGASLGVVVGGAVTVESGAVVGNATAAVESASDCPQAAMIAIKTAATASLRA
jgi:hypothetical protein